MRNNYIEQIDKMTRDLKEELQNFLFLDNLKNLVNKLTDKQFNKEKEQFVQLLNALKVVSDVYNRKNRSEYLKYYNAVRKTVREKYGFRKRGELFGICFGTIYPICVAFGILFKNTGLAAGLGIVFSSAVAQMKEKAAEKKGLIY